MKLRLLNALIIAAFAMPAFAQDFFKDKTISIITSTGEGGSYDGAARTLARHMPRYIPGNPTMVVRNMPGGGHTRATNFLYTQATKDGTTIGTVSNSIPMHQLVDGRGVRFDVAKFHWIGSVGLSNLTMAFWHTSKVRSLADAMKREVTMGATGTGSGTFLYPNAINKVLGTKFKIISGYRTSVEVDLAMERGEVEGRGGGSYSTLFQEHPDWLKDGKLIIAAQIGRVRDPLMPDAPLITELAGNEEQRQILEFLSSPVAVGRPYIAPPEVPADRIAILRKAFDETMRDKAFLEESEKQSLDIRPMKGEVLEKIVQEAVKTPPDILEKVRKIIEVNEGGK
jgi:tripartite-type tricarboxylate transporter receptor subunit TctC